VRRQDFEKLVAEALDGLPGEFRRLLWNIVVIVETEPSRALQGGAVPHPDPAVRQGRTLRDLTEARSDFPMHPPSAFQAVPRPTTPENP
jgi:predicted Zn-dependent protease with MMP-like domain